MPQIASSSARNPSSINQRALKKEFKQKNSQKRKESKSAIQYAGGRFCRQSYVRRSRPRAGGTGGVHLCFELDGSRQRPGLQRDAVRLPASRVRRTVPTVVRRRVAAVRRP